MILKFKRTNNKTMKTKLLRKIRLRARKMVSLSSERGDPGVLRGYRVVWSKKNRFKFTRYHTAFFEVKDGCKSSEVYRIHLKAIDFALKKTKEWEQYFLWTYKKKYRWPNLKKDWRKCPGVNHRMINI